MSKTTYPDFDNFDFSALFRIQEELAQATNAMSGLLQSNITDTLKLYQSYLKNFSLSELNLSNQIKEIAKTISTYQSIAIPTESLKYIAEALQFYNSPAIVEQMKYITSALATEIDPTLIEAASAIDLSEFQLEDNGNLYYDGIQYSPEEVTAELEKQVKIVKAEKPALREKFEALKQKLWLVLLIINLLLLLPDIPEKVEFYNDMVSQALDIAREKSQICFTIKEHAYLREEPNSHSVKILILKYDTPLEILEAVPRWYQVRYTDDDGLETIGWISKISVETEG